MGTYVLDASALLRYLDKEAGYDRIRELLTSLVRNEIALVISAVQWGEIACKLSQRHGQARTEYLLSQLSSLGLTVEAATAERSVLAGFLKTATKLAYADAFCVQLAMELPGNILVTADYGFKPAEHLVKVEFLPPK